MSPIGISGLGNIFVYGYSLVPFPPAIITTGTSQRTSFDCSILASISCKKHISMISFCSLTIGNAVITFCFINSLDSDFLHIGNESGLVFIISLASESRLPDINNHLLISPSESAPHKQLLSSITNTIPAELSSIFFIASAILVFFFITYFEITSFVIITSIFYI